MIDLNKEAEEYRDYWFNARNLYIKDIFIAGANSKHVQAKILQAQIDLILHLKDTFQFSFASSAWKDKLISLQQQLKQLENE